MHIFETIGRRFSRSNHQADCNIYVGWKTVETWYEKVYDPAVIYGRALGLRLSPRSINIEEISVHELAPFATDMFDTPIETKITKSKCNLNNFS